MSGSRTASPRSATSSTASPRSTTFCCRAGSEANDEIVAAARAAGALRPEFTAGDLHALVLGNALALKHGERPHRDDYDRRTAYLLDGIRPRRSASDGR
ncbi:hypothetical protein ACSLFT_23970 [Streptomyces sp. G6]|uniref:SbtR family transcriptional regulator n=1 Tax=Streptomyces sp. G6 TaxID=1178736 RepID=UPI003ED8F5A1